MIVKTFKFNILSWFHCILLGLKLTISDGQSSVMGQNSPSDFANDKKKTESVQVINQINDLYITYYDISF